MRSRALPSATPTGRVHLQHRLLLTLRRAWRCAQLVELKSGETYNGHLVQCDTWMNLHLKEVICTSKVRPPSPAFAPHPATPPSPHK